MRKIKILYVIDKMHVAGSQKHMLQLLRTIDTNAFQPYLCCLQYGGELFEEARKSCAKTIILNIKKIYDLTGIIGISKLVNFIKNENIDIVHTFLFSANVLGNIAAKLAGAPVIISARRDTGVHREGKWRHRQGYKIAHRFADRVFAVSNAVRDVVRSKEGVSLDKLVTLYNGVDMVRAQEHPSTSLGTGKDTKAQVRKSLGINERDYVVGIVASLNWFKGHKYFLEATELIVNRLPNTKFLIVGNGPLRNDLEFVVKNSGLNGHVIFLGNRSDIPELLSAMDVSVNASYSEGMSNSILESMAAAIPVVATDVDGNKEAVFNNETGFLVPLKDSKAMADKIIYLLENKDIAEKMGESARKKIQTEFSVSKMLKNIEHIYSDLLKEKCDEYCHS